MLQMVINITNSSVKVGRKAVGPEMDCKAAEVVEFMAYTIFGRGFFIA